MTIQEKVDALVNDGLEVSIFEDEYRIINRTFETVTYIGRPTFEEMNVRDIVAATHQGRNVENITRVTGYFAKIKGWNKGKVAELKDRYRSTVEKEA